MSDNMYVISEDGCTTREIIDVDLKYSITLRTNTNRNEIEILNASGDVLGKMVFKKTNIKLNIAGGKRPIAETVSIDITDDVKEALGGILKSNGYSLDDLDVINDKIDIIGPTVDVEIYVDNWNDVSFGYEGDNF